jgi:hypothetical protein
MLQCTMPSWAKARPRHYGVPHEAVHPWRRRQTGERGPHLGLAEHAAERHCWASAGMCARLGWSYCECGVLLCVLVLEDLPPHLCSDPLAYTSSSSALAAVAVI